MHGQEDSRGHLQNQAETCQGPKSPPVGEVGGGGVLHQMVMHQGQQRLFGEGCAFQGRLSFLKSGPMGQTLVRFGWRLGHGPHPPLAGGSPNAYRRDDLSRNFGHNLFRRRLPA